MDPGGIKCLFPEVPNTREKKSLAVFQISGKDSEESPVVVLDSGGFEGGRQVFCSGRSVIGRNACDCPR
eukprot:1258157-Amphidinium_carterae.1